MRFFQPIDFFPALVITPILAVAMTAHAEAPDGDPSSTITWEPHRFESNSGRVVEAELGTLPVPENRERPDSRAIELSFVRFASTAEDPGSPIVYLAGGPGGSGIGAAAGPRFPLFMALREHADVIALDQRGTGRSGDLPPCELEAPLPLDRPLERGSARGLLEREVRRCAAFWREAGIDLGGYDTAQSADDLEALRQALGVPKLTLWGISYGTHLAFAALDRHPDSFDRVILASAEGPDETVKLPGRTQAFLERADTWLARRGADGPGLVASLSAVLERLEEHPATASAPHPGTGDLVSVGIGTLDVRLLTGFMIKNPDSLRQLLPLLRAAAEGDFSALASAVARLRLHLDDLQAMPLAMDAASGISPARRARILAERDEALLGDVLNFPLLPGWDLAGWLGIEPLPASFREPPRSDVPALFLSGTLDGRTYVESHRALARGFPNAAHVLVEGAGHDLFLASPEIEERILEFLARGTTAGDPIRTGEAEEDAAGARAGLRRRVAEYLDPYLATENFSGTVLLARGYTVLLSRGYDLADRSHGVPNTPGIRFHVASLSKSFTAAAVLLLAQRGRVDLREPLSSILPDFPRGDELTLHHLLSHTSGIPDINGFPEYGELAIRPQTPASLAEVIAGRPLSFPPGDHYDYSNSNYALLALVIEEASGLSYGEFLRRELLEPLGLLHTGHDGDSRQILPHQAEGYQPEGIFGVERAPRFDWSVKTGNGSLYSTVGDLHRWVRGLFGGRLLEPRWLERMTTEHTDGVGYGWFLGDRHGVREIRLTGRSPGFSSHLAYYPGEEVTVVVLSNLYNSATREVGKDLGAIALGESVEAPALRRDSVPPMVRERLVGKYRFGPDFYRPGFVMTVREEGGHLFEDWGALIPVSDTEFYDRTYWSRVRFELSGEGVATRMWFDEHAGARVED